MRQDQKKKNPKQNEIIFWRAGPLEYRLPPLSEYCRNPSMSVYQLALLWEAEFGFIDVFFWRLFQWVCSFHDEWFTNVPTQTVLTIQQVLTKNVMTSVPHPPYSL